jgi:hypothetical protein
MEILDLEDAATELYALAPADFTSQRARLSASARKEGRADVAKEIAELRKPTAAAWLINQLARGEQEAGPDLERLEALGVALREAQSRLDGTQMRELAKQRQEIVRALVRRAADLLGGTGQKLSAAVQRELEETYGAAVADEQAALAVLSGRLTRALVYAGMGEVDVTAATATPLSSVRPARVAKRPASSGPAAGSTDQDPAQVQAQARAAARDEAAEKAKAAQEALLGAEEDLAEAARQQEEAAAEEARLSAELVELQDQIVRTRHELDAVERRLGGTQREHQRRERQLKEARDAARRGSAELARLESEVNG